MTLTIVFVGPTATCLEAAAAMAINNVTITTDSTFLDSLHGPITIYLCPGYDKLSNWLSIRNRILGLSGHAKIYQLAIIVI